MINNTQTTAQNNLLEENNKKLRKRDLEVHRLLQQIIATLPASGDSAYTENEPDGPWKFEAEIEGDDDDDADNRARREIARKMLEQVIKMAEALVASSIARP